MSSKSNSFLESLKVDAETQAKLAEVSKNYNGKKENSSSKRALDEGGRERGDDGPGSLGREAGLKSGTKTQLNNCLNAIKGYKSNKGTQNHSSLQHGSISQAGKTSHGINGSHGGISGGSKGSHASGANGGHGGLSGGHGSSSGGHGGSSGGGHGK